MKKILKYIIDLLFRLMHTILIIPALLIMLLSIVGHFPWWLVTGGNLIEASIDLIDNIYGKLLDINYKITLKLVE